jgi:hypothetical protein
MSLNVHPYELAEMTEEELQIPPSTPTLPSASAPVPGSKEWNSYKEFWSDSCWGGPIDW